MIDRFIFPAEPVDPAGWYSVGREETGEPYRVLGRIRAEEGGPWESDADLARALDRAAPRAVQYVRSARGSEILAGGGR